VSTTIPKIYGWLTKEYFIQFTYSDNAGTPTLTPTSSFLLPKELNLEGVNHSTTPSQGTFKAENMDLGHQFLVVLSPVQCKATYKVDGTTSPSAYFYDLSNTDIHYDLINCDENPTYFSKPDGLEDYKGCTDDMDTTDPAKPV
jgi:hypothetical protein